MGAVMIQVQNTIMRIALLISILSVTACKPDQSTLTADPLSSVAGDCAELVTGDIDLSAVDSTADDVTPTDLATSDLATSDLATNDAAQVAAVGNNGFQYPNFDNLTVTSDKELALAGSSTVANLAVIYQQVEKLKAQCGHLKNASKVIEAIGKIIAGKDAKTVLKQLATELKLEEKTVKWVATRLTTMAGYGGAASIVAALAWESYQFGDAIGTYLAANIKDAAASRVCDLCLATGQSQQLTSNLIFRPASDAGTAIEVAKMACMQIDNNLFASAGATPSWSKCRAGFTAGNNTAVTPEPEPQPLVQVTAAKTSIDLYVLGFSADLPSKVTLKKASDNSNLNRNVEYLATIYTKGGDVYSGYANRGLKAAGNHNYSWSTGSLRVDEIIFHRNSCYVELVMWTGVFGKQTFEASFDANKKDVKGPCL
jgi:hypothetical protein